MAGSSQWASSTTHSTRFSSAAAVSSDRVATPTRNGSTDGPSSSPNATRRARAWGAGSSSRSRITGRSSRCSAANASGASTSSPWVRSTVASPACDDELVEQGRLAHARLAAHHHAAGRSVSRLLDERCQVRPLGLTADQHASNVHRRDRPAAARTRRFDRGDAHDRRLGAGLEDAQ